MSHKVWYKSDFLRLSIYCIFPCYPTFVKKYKVQRGVYEFNFSESRKRYAKLTTSHCTLLTFRAILLSKSHPFCPSYSWLNTKKGTSKTKKHPNVNFLSLHYVKSWLPLGGHPGKTLSSTRDE